MKLSRGEAWLLSEVEVYLALTIHTHKSTKSCPPNFLKYGIKILWLEIILLSLYQ